MTTIYPGEIRKVREAMGITQAELAALLDVNPKIPSRWENGVSPQPSTLRLLEHLYDDFLHRPRVYRQRRNDAAFGARA